MTPKTALVSHKFSYYRQTDRQTDKQTDVRQHRRLMRLVGGGITSCKRAATTISRAETWNGSAQRQQTANNLSKKL